MFGLVPRYGFRPRTDKSKVTIRLELVNRYRRYRLYIVLLFTASTQVAVGHCGPPLVGLES